MDIRECVILECKKRIIKPPKRAAFTVAEKIRECHGPSYTDQSLQHRFICQTCYMNLNKRRRVSDLGEPTTSQTPEKKLLDENFFIQTLDEKFEQFSDAAQSKIMGIIGKRLSKPLKSLAEGQRFESKNLEDLCVSTSGALWDQAPTLVQSFLTAIADGNTEEVKFFARALEALCQLVHKNFISQFSFKIAILIAGLTNSKATNEIINACLPSGDSKSHRNILNRVLEKAGLPVLPGHSDAVCVFDNQQVVGKPKSVTPWASNPISTCTAVLHAFYSDSALQIDDLFNLEDFLGPGHSKTTTLPNLIKAVEISDSEAEEATVELKKFFNDCLKRVQEERKCGSGFAKYMSDMGDVISNFDTSRKCEKCLNDCARSAKICKVCRHELPTAAQSKAYVKTEIDRLRSSLSSEAAAELLGPRFDHIENGPSITPVFINDDPIFELPNSFVSCTKILRDLGKRLGIKRYGTGFRNYVVLACDGQPYNLIVKIIENSIFCSGCQESFWGEEKFRGHKCTKDSALATPDYEFTWVLLQMGYGHLEMNYFRTVISLFWKDYFQPIAWLLNFRTETAQAYAKAAKDTHMAFEMFVIARYSMMFELIDKFLSEATAVSPTFDNFMKFVESDSMPANVQESWCFLKDVLQPFFLFRAGVRKNRSSYVQIGLKQSLPIFYASKARVYQRIVLHHLITRFLLPSQILAFLEKTQSVGEYGEGMDFRLEEWNRVAKRFLTYVTTKLQWIRVYRNLDMLLKLRASTFAELKIWDPKSEKRGRKRIFSLTTEKIRAVIRRVELYNKTAPSNLFEEEITELVGSILEKGHAALRQKLTSIASPSDEVGDLLELEVSDTEEISDVLTSDEEPDDEL